MAWTTPTTRITGELITAATWNADITDNLLYLLQRPHDMQRVDEGSNYTTTSTTFVDIDATDLSKTVDIKSGRAFVIFIGSITHSNGRGYFDIAVDGTRQGLDDGLVVQATRDTYVTPHTVVCAYPVTGLSEGSHTFKIQWKVDTGTLTMYAGAGTSGFDVHPMMFVLEF